ncbi:MAG: MFS transporter [Methylacidiphilales bacterium]|nr:MFS transporter [Candidatus Methylacidiphilales bacterium]MDW8349718.1 MFS transporter [Verrucomicrobiae bacterium]
MKAEAGMVRRREVVAWAFFDFANSSFTTVMVTVLFPVYFVNALAPSVEVGQRLWGWGGAVANGLVVVLGPWLGLWADRAGCKKAFLLGSTVVCVGGTVALGWISAEAWLWGLGLFVLANVAFLIGENFVASFLPEISTRENVGRISSYGWGIGYVGGLLSLILARQCEDEVWAFVLTGIFFALASLPTFLILRERGVRRAERGGGLNVRARWDELIRPLKESGEIRWMLVVFFMISGGLATVVYFSSIFAEAELGMGRGELTVMFMALQFAAILGALVTGWMQDRWGWRVTLIGTLVLWCGTVVGCYGVRSVEMFYGVAACAGYGIGGVQTGVRAALSRFTRGDEAGRVFGFWGCAGKLAPVVFLPLFSEVASLWSLRGALIVPLAGFGLGLCLLIIWQPGKAKQEKG